MNVTELRNSEHIESVEQFEGIWEWSSREYWHVTPVRGAYDDQEALRFLLNETEHNATITRIAKDKGLIKRGFICEKPIRF